MKTKSSFKSSILGMQGNLLSFAMKLTLDKEDAQDLVQDTTLKALTNQDKYAENTNIKGWMMTIMRNIFINNYRKSMREKTTVDTTDNQYHLNASQIYSSDSPEGAYTVAEISKIIASFPEESRQPFSMHIRGYKYEEIAEILSMPLGTVKNRIFNTRRQLRAILKNYN